MQWVKDPNMKYTDMCIYIDENVPKLLNPGEYPEIEEKIYNYLWLLVKALAIKKCMFPNFDDYDQYSFYAANRLFFALRKNLTNQGKTIKGKYIKPIKSCLNYTKALLYPMKIEYLRQAYKEVLDTRFVSKQFDPDKFKNNLKQSARESLGENQLHMQLLRLSLGNMSGIVDRVMKRTPIHINGLDYKYLRISLLLTAQECLRTKGALVDSSCTVVLWHLPKSITSYLHLLFKEFITELKKEMLGCYEAIAMDDNTIEAALQENDQTYRGD